MDNLFIDDLFMDIENIHYVASRLHNLYYNNTKTASAEVFSKWIFKQMSDWALANDISKFRSAAPYSLAALEFANEAFIKYITDVIHSNQPSYLRVPPEPPYVSNPNRTLHNGKLLKDMLVEDIKNLDLYNEKMIQVSNDNFRYHNALDLKQVSAQKRHYDRNNSEGLALKGNDMSVDRRPTFNVAFDDYANFNNPYL